MHWFFAHAWKMMGAYSASITAFCKNILPIFLPKNTPSFLFIMTWTTPGIILRIISARIIKKFKIEAKPRFSAKIK